MTKVEEAAHAVLHGGGPSIWIVLRGGTTIKVSLRRSDGKFLPVFAHGGRRITLARALELEAALGVFGEPR